MDPIATNVASLADLLPLAGEHYPATLTHNEGWLLRLLLDWSARHHQASGPLAIPPDGDWYSEAMLPSPFLPRYRGDPLGETWTHADGVVGHFRIGAAAKADLSLAVGATHLAVLEAKLFSGLSAGIAHASDYDQAARTVACMAEVLRRAGSRPAGVALAFTVLAPQSQIDRGLFVGVTAESIGRQVAARVETYGHERDDWHDRWFLPTLERTRVEVVSWEEVIAAANRAGGDWVEGLREFYRRCLEANAPASAQPSLPPSR
ncbi:MAG: hypothetical protein ACYC5O_21450 [Anaerolineae bacterium]